jgi:hypothetical protein
MIAPFRTPKNDPEEHLQPSLDVVQLKILACNVSGGELQGTISVNGSPVQPKEFRNQSAVVWQSDVLLSSATVRAHTAFPSTECSL